jgi:hypothetical protein
LHVDAELGLHLARERGGAAHAEHLCQSEISVSQRSLSEISCQSETCSLACAVRDFAATSIMSPCASERCTSQIARRDGPQFRDAPAGSSGSICRIAAALYRRQDSINRGCTYVWSFYISAVSAWT